MAKGFKEPGEKPRRFYKTVEVRACDDGFEVTLDGRILRSPRGGKLVAPTRAIAEMCAEEWAGQGEHIEMAAMHVTRLAFTAVEAIPPAREAVADQIAQYAGSDLLCYFADSPAALVERHENHWGPMLDRAREEIGLVFLRTSGIQHQEQPAETLARVKSLALELNDFELAGLAFGAPLLGSTVLAFALQRGWISGDQAMELSRLDETFQEEQWGVDEEAAERAANLKLEARMLERWFKGLK